MAGLDLAVIVVTYQSRMIVPECLAALPDALRGVETWNVVVVDNGSTDGTTNLVAERFPDATVVEMGRNAGYAAAINVGVRASGDPSAVLVLNPDIRLEPVFKDSFSGLAAPSFTRDARGVVTGFVHSSAGVRHLRFDRVRR